MRTRKADGPFNADLNEIGQLHDQLAGLAEAAVVQAVHSDESIALRQAWLRTEADAAGGGEGGGEGGEGGGGGGCLCLGGGGGGGGEGGGGGDGGSGGGGGDGGGGGSGGGRVAAQPKQWYT